MMMAGPGGMEPAGGAGGAGPGGGADPVNNVSPEMAAQGKKYADRYEDLFLGGQRLWNNMKKKWDGKPKKLYFIGMSGNLGDEVAESVLDSLAYIPAPDGTYFIHRKPGGKYPKIQYTMWESDKKLSEKARISPVDLYMEDEDEFRALEEEVIKSFSEVDADYGPEDQGYPAGIVVGEGAVLSQKNRDIMKDGLVIWLDVDPTYSWQKVQFRPQTGGGLFVPQDFQSRPPVWCIANGWDGDIDDAEGKMEYEKVGNERRKIYEEMADIRLRTDIPGIGENSYWGAERIIKALNELLGFKAGDDASVEEDVLESDLKKFLEGARLTKYLTPAMEWCDEQGAASIEDVVENIPDFADALAFKPLERKRLEKAAASLAATL